MSKFRFQLNRNIMRNSLNQSSPLPQARVISSKNLKEHLHKTEHIFVPWPSPPPGDLVPASKHLHRWSYRRQPTVGIHSCRLMVAKGGLAEEPLLDFAFLFLSLFLFLFSLSFSALCFYQVKHNCNYKGFLNESLETPRGNHATCAISSRIPQIPP